MISDEHLQELKQFIFDELRSTGSEETNANLDTLIFQSKYSLRLRKAGYFLLRNLYASESFDLEEKLTGKELLTLKRYVGWPYYLTTNHSKLVLFTMKETFVLKLNGGNVKKWLEETYRKNSS